MILSIRNATAPDGKKSYRQLLQSQQNRKCIKYKRNRSQIIVYNSVQLAFLRGFRQCATLKYDLR